MNHSQRNIVLYQAYGKRYINQTIFSIISLINVYKRQLDGLEILIYTDHPEDFIDLNKVYNIKAVFISEQQRKTWAGDGNFILRSKIIVPLEILKTDSSINILQVDSDTFFKKKLDKLFYKIRNDKLVMHLREQRIAYIRKKWHPSFYPPNVERKIENDLHIKLNDQTYMWNSGVIGMSNKNQNLLQSILELNDELYQKYPNWLIEQLSYTTVFSATKKLIDSKEYIFHYYHYKSMVDDYMEDKLTQHDDVQVLINIIKSDKLDRKIIYKYYYDYLYIHTRDFVRTLLGREEIFKRRKK
jgi:hypothetical protein